MFSQIPSSRMFTVIVADIFTAGKFFEYFDDNNAFLCHNFGNIRGSGSPGAPSPTGFATGSGVHSRSSQRGELLRPLVKIPLQLYTIGAIAPVEIQNKNLQLYFWVGAYRHI